MKEHGLIVSEPLVLPILDDVKTVTRRLSPKWDRVRVGDRLWVRENWRLAHGGWFPEEGSASCQIEYVAGTVFNRRGTCRSRPIDCDRAWLMRESVRVERSKDRPVRPSLLMPRFACRIILEVTEPVRVERLHDITEEDAVREGVEPVFRCDDPSCDCRAERKRAPHVHGFRAKWFELHGASWEKNPRVRRIAFRRLA